MLTIRGIEAGYGAIKVLKKLDLDVQKGEIVTLIGANGAGKTTVLRVISGLLAPGKGEITFENERITGLPPHKTLRRGICLVPEGREILSDMTVLENLLMGGYLMDSVDLAKDAAEKVLEKYTRLRERRDQRAGVLSGGERRLLEISRALIMNPDVLLVDEPSIGLEPRFIDMVFEILDDLQNKDGKTIIMVEQNAKKGLEFADVGYVLVSGQLAKAGKGKELLEDSDVGRLFLGG